MITIFTTAKSFVGQMRINQINAITSWKQLGPDIDVLLFGHGEGYLEVARDLGLKWIDQVEVSASGTPLITSMFELARQKGCYPTQLYVNCDIILLGNVPEILRSISKECFLAIGQRWDIDLEEEIEFSNPNWKTLLQSRVLKSATLHPPLGSDYFLYHGNVWADLPTLVVGRGAYDNYLIYYCRIKGVPVIDLTEMMMAIHQNHDYRHHPNGYQGVFYGPDAEINSQDLDKNYFFTPVEADFRIITGKMRHNYCRGNLFKYLQSRHFINQKTGLHPFITKGISIYLWIHHIGGLLRKKILYIYDKYG
jgi:hypothetical protein